MENKIFPVRKVKCKTRRCSVMWCNNPATDIYTKGVREVYSGTPVRLCKSCAEEIGRLAGMVKPEEIPVPAAETPKRRGRKAAE